MLSKRTKGYSIMRLCKMPLSMWWTPRRLSLGKLSLWWKSSMVYSIKSKTNMDQSTLARLSKTNASTNTWASSGKPSILVFGRRKKTSKIFWKKCYVSLNLIRQWRLTMQRPVSSPSKICWWWSASKNVWTLSNWSSITTLTSQCDPFANFSKNLSCLLERELWRLMMEPNYSKWESMIN